MNIGVLVSGSGSNLQAIMDACRDGSIDGRVVVVVSNNSSAYGLERARQQGVAAFHISSRTHPGADAVDRAIVEVLKGFGAHVVCLAGYMKRCGPLLLEGYPNHVLNIHPALLPDYGGRGYYGKNVHMAVIQDRCAYSGATVHLVDEHYDHGPVLAQVRVPVETDDTPDSLAARILIQEHRLYPMVLSMIASEDIDLDSFDASGWTPIIMDHE